MSDANKSPFKSFNASTTDAYEDDLLTWLQDPADDAFERTYCSDVFQGEWAPQSATEAAKNINAGVVTYEQNGSSTSSMATSMCETRSVPHPAHARKLGMGTKPSLILKPLCNINAEKALAQGAARAAGQSLRVGHDTYNKVRTLMQPTHADYAPSSGTPCHLLNAHNESKDHHIKPNFPVSSIPACAPKLLKNATITRLNIVDSPPSCRTKHATPETTKTFTSKRARTEFEAYSHTHQTESSHITEEGCIERGKVIMGADRKYPRTSMSCSGASQSSMSLSGRETAYSGKQKQEELELLSKEYAAEDDLMDMKKGRKSVSRRTRVAEVHNLSERNRRNRINEKLKALQDLIPNSSKTDKASVLDEAIEYMKTLQMQLQMISMRSSLNVPAMMMPMNFPQAHMQMAQPHSIGLGVPIGHAAGMGMGLGVKMAEAGSLTTPTLLQSPAAMSQLHAMVPFQNGSMAGFAHMGFHQAPQISPSMQDIRGSYDFLAQRASYMHQHEQGQSLLCASHNLEHEELSTEQDELSE